MKLTTLILITAILQVSASAFAQKVTLYERNASLNKIFEKISDQTGYDFLISTANLRIAKSVTIDVQKEELHAVLDKIFEGQPLSFVIQEKMVVVSKKEPTPVNQPKSAIENPLTVTGRVTDSLGHPLQGATVLVNNNHASAMTDPSGNFSFPAQIGDQVTVSYIGYKPYTFQVTGEMPFQNIVLHTVSGQLSEVIVNTGYQDIPRERATGSFSQPIKEMYEDRVAPDVLTKLNGITSGLVFNANTTATQNGQLDINIRGRSTIFANDQPLIVVDNFPYSGDINNINPNDVESVTVLKDAASASIWGVRAGNGVIVITTKKGKLNQPLKVGFNASLTVFNKPNLNYNPNQVDASTFIGLEKYLFGQGYYDSDLTNTTLYPVISPVVQLLAANRAGTLSTNDLNAQLNALGGLNVNNQLSKYFYQKATDQQYALNLSGGSDKASYYFSAGYDNDLAGAKGNANQRITINSQNTFRPIKNLELSAGVNVVQTDIKANSTLGALSGSYFPYSQFANAQGQPLSIPYIYSQSFVQNAPSNGFLDWSYTPLNELAESDNITKVMDIRLSTGIKYTIIKGLSAEVKYQYENSNSQNNDYDSQQTFYTRNLINEFSSVDPVSGMVNDYIVPLGGILNINNSATISNNVRGQLNYNYDWGNNSISALAGYELSETTANYNQSTLYGYDNDLATFTSVDAANYYQTNPSGNYANVPSGLGIGSTLARFRSSFANAAYTYKDRYTLSGSTRIDGSNYFGVATNQKSVPLWSAGAKWDIDKENFYKLDWLPALALRASYGYNGNLDQAVTGITTFQYYSNAQYTNLNYAQISNIGNPDLRWEKTGIANLGIDFGTKNNVITGSLEYFLKKETDLLGFKSFAENSGITQLEGNYSDMKGHGLDLTISSRNLDGSFKWYTTLLFSHATDEVTHYDVNPFGYQLVGAGTGTPNVGKPVFGVYGYKWGGLDPATGNPIGFLNGAPSQDYAAITTGTPVSKLVYVGSARPTYFGGFNNYFSYKGFRLAVQINYKLGYYFMAPALSYSRIASNGEFLNVNRQFNERWQNPGDKTNVPSMVYPFSPARDQFYQYSTVNIENADHVRLQDVSLSYDFNKAVYHKLPFSTLQLFVYANNVGLIWKANHAGLDPDAVPGAGDNNTMPAPRSIAIGVKGSF